MSWYGSRTDGELVALAAGGDRRARACLVDRTLLPASRVAVHLHDDRDAAVEALVDAYRRTHRRIPRLEDGERFLPALLAHLDATTPFPLDPATHAPLDPVDRDRVRAAVLGEHATRRGAALPLAAVLAVVIALVLVLVTLPGGDPVTVDSTPAGSGGTTEPTTTGTSDVLGSTTQSSPRASPTPTDTDQPSSTDTPDTDGATDTGDTVDGGTGTGELAETR